MKIGNHTIYKYTLALISANMYLIISQKKALLIDPNVSEEATSLLEKQGVTDITVVLTHEHFDHISGVNHYREFAKGVGGKCMVYAGAKCAEQIKDPDNNLSSYFEIMFFKKSEEERILAEKVFDRTYSCEADEAVLDGFALDWEDLKIVFRDTPGHSPGSICVEIYDATDSLCALVTGDSLVNGNRVITRLPGGSRAAYRDITEPYLRSFGPDTVVLPGHGEISSIGCLEIG